MITNAISFKRRIDRLKLSLTFLFEKGHDERMEKHQEFASGDVLVLFGELFQRGYANGLVEKAQEKGMTIIRSTVGRRDESQNLRPLNDEESKSFTGPWINLPLECGFDLEPGLQGLSPVDLCKSIGLKEGIQGKIDLNSVLESRKKGHERFRKQVRNWVDALKTHIKPGKKILIAHLMAGGVPRSKIILSLMNRIFKGTGDRHLGSEDFWNSDLGRLCEQSFLEVTAESFNVLIEETAELRKQQENSGGYIRYSAYGYHGTRIFVDGKPQWLTYTPYVQGFAKKKLEDYARYHWNQGVQAVVYNCPEILTNSSSIFPGVEIFLYLILFEIRSRSLKNTYINAMLDRAEECLQTGKLQDVHALIKNYLKNPLFLETLKFDQWPSHSNRSQMELMLGISDQIISLHKDSNNLMTTHLSEIVIHSCGALMLNDMSQPKAPVSWLGHDVILDHLESGKG